MTEDKPTDKQVAFLESKDIGIPHTKGEATLIIGAWIEQHGGNGDAKPILDSSNKIPIPSPEVVKIPNALALVGDKLVEVKPKDNGFHLTPEQCRSNALASAIETTREMQGNLQQTILDLAKIYEKYIVTGE